jgi:2,3-bisphosphoglycerate-independent phosphoglycerate mutase
VTRLLPEAAVDPSLLWEELARDGGRIALLVVDGLGGLPDPKTGRSELATATTPHLDELAAGGACGLIEPVAAGVTPGSGPGHLALFGYHPLRYRIGRGILSALGSEFELVEGDVAARVNFATVDAWGRVQDRRAGRIATEENRALCKRIRENVTLEDGVEWFLEPVRDHRAVLVLRGPGLSGAVGDTDPHRTGVAPRPVEARQSDARRTARLVECWVDRCGRVLAGEKRANAILLRGFGTHRPLPSLEARFGLRGACLAEYSMYRGLSRLLGLEVAPRPGDPTSLFERELPSYWREDHDFCFLHFKATDSSGEDGHFDAKVAALEQLDGLIPHLVALDPAVLVVTGDHSTPARMAEHSWHPVPLLIRAPSARVDDVRAFDELACARGALGLRPTLDVMGLALGHAGRLRKFGA